MRTLTDQRLDRFASVAITIGVALIAAGLVGMVAPWPVAALSLLLVARPTRDRMRPDVHHRGH